MSDHTTTSAKGTQMENKSTKQSSRKGPCPWLCNLVPRNLPPPGPAQAVLHPRKDVFVLKTDNGILRVGHRTYCSPLEGSRKFYEPARSARMPLKVNLRQQIAKVGPNGDRRCKMELELVTPKGPEKKPPCRIDTRETQCEPDPPPCCCMRQKKKRKN